MNTETTVPGELHEIRQRLDHGDKRMASIEAALAENTTATHEIRAATTDIVDFFNSAQGAFRVLEMLGKLARPLAAVAALVAAVGGAWTVMKSGHDITPKP